jgi:acyl carrier protein
VLDNQQIITELKGLLIKDLFVELEPNQIGEQDGLQSTIGLDSVGFIELRVLCERRFGIEISDMEFAPENFSSLSRLASLISRKTVPGSL